MTNKGGKEVHKNIKLSFIHWCRYMASSLDKLDFNLHGDQCQNRKEFYTVDEVPKLMRCKCVYPYESMSSLEKVEETKLPQKNAFYSKLKMKGINYQDHEHAQKIWNKKTAETEPVNAGDYHDIYIATEGLLLADYFETFRKTYLKCYHLDPTYFYSAPGLSWQALLITASEFFGH